MTMNEPTTAIHDLPNAPSWFYGGRSGTRRRKAFAVRCKMSRRCGSGTVPIRWRAVCGSQGVKPTVILQGTLLCYVSGLETRSPIS